MKNTQFVKMILAVAAILAVPQQAFSQLVLDNFSTGSYEKSLKAGSDTNVQSGGMIGGNRATTFFMCPPGPCGLDNQFDQAASFQIRPKTKIAPAALVFSAGYKVSPRLDVYYGSPTALSLNLSAYDRLRVNFDGANQGMNYNILVFTNGLYSQTGCNLSPPFYGAPYSVDFPFADFTPGQGTPGADFSNITLIDFIDQSEGAFYAANWAITSFEAIPIGAPPGDVTCLGF
jgi:hypothetical protein